MRGRKPSSTAPAPSPLADVPRPPSYLSKDAKLEWKRMAPLLILERRTLDVGDMPTFAAYCVAAGEVAEASRIIAAEGMTYSGASGPKRHPAVAIRSDAMKQVRQLAGELGLTPVSRSRAPMRAAEADDPDAMDLGL
jgi:P27 family predicted phage terminase small subunit